MAAILQGASCLLHLSYFEGFGLPVAEAMACGIPVVASNRASLPEVLGELLVDPENTQECVQALAQILTDQEFARYLAQKALKRSKNFTWNNASSLIVKECEKLSRHSETILAESENNTVKLGLVTTWGIDCGIAIYSKNLVDALSKIGTQVTILTEHASPETDDSIPIKKCWNRGHSLDDLLNTIITLKLNLVNIQHHPAFFRDDELSIFLWRLKAKNIPAIVTFHEIEPNQPNAIYLVPDNILVHTHTAAQLLHKMGIASSIKVIAHGIPDFSIPPRKQNDSSTIRILSNGFLQPSKGFHVGIEALALLKEDFPNLSYRIVGASRPGAEHYPQHLKNLAQQLNVAAQVDIKEKYLAEKELAQEISNADILIYPYLHHTAGSSGAITMALAAGSAIITSPSPYFDDLGDSVLRAASPQEFAQAIRKLIHDQGLAKNLRDKTKALAAKQSWSSLGAEHTTAYRKIISSPPKKLITPWVSVHIISKETDLLGLHFFQSCLQSIRGYPEQLIIVDNGSSPEVLEMVREELKNFNGKLFLKPELKNFRDLRNIALENTDKQATHIHWIDTDEIFFPHQLPELRTAMRYEDIALLQTVLIHFMIDPVTLQDRQIKRNIFKFSPQMRWSKSVHEVINGLPPGRPSFIPIEHLHFGYCRPQWQTFLKWIRYAILEHGSVDMYRHEQIEGRRLPWLRGARTPDTILDERFPKLRPYDGPISPKLCFLARKMEKFQKTMEKIFTPISRPQFLGMVAKPIHPDRMLGAYFAIDSRKNGIE